MQQLPGFWLLLCVCPHAAVAGFLASAACLPLMQQLPDFWLLLLLCHFFPR
jgi:hypothetical protein